MSRDDAQFRIRFPHELHDRIRGAAAINRRTITDEIVSRLTASFAQEALPGEPTPAIETTDPVARALALAEALERIARATETIARHHPGVETSPT